MATTTTARSKGFLNSLLLVLLIIIIAGLLSVSYSVGVAMLLGVIAAWGFLYAVGRTINYVKRSTRRIRAVSIVSLAVGAVGLSVFVSLFDFYDSVGDLPPPLPSVEKTPITLVRYSATVKPVQKAGSGAFKVQEAADIRFGSTKKYKTYISTHTLPPGDEENGYLLRKVKFRPLEDWYFTRPRTDSTYRIYTNPYQEVGLKKRKTDKRWRGRLCPERCLSTQVTLLHFPANSFLRADNKHDLTKEPPAAPTEVNWSIDDLDRAVTFTCIAPPYNNIPLAHAVVAPLETFSYYGSPTAFFLGTVMMGAVRFVTSIVMEQTLLGWWANRLKPWMRRVKRKILEREAAPEEQTASTEEQETEDREGAEEPRSGEDGRGPEWL